MLPRSYLYLGENPQFCNRCTQEFPRGRAPEHLAEENPAEWRQAWERNPGLRENYPHLAPRTAAAQHAPRYGLPGSGKPPGQKPCLLGRR